jgi:hypothetical protein
MNQDGQSLSLADNLAPESVREVVLKKRYVGEEISASELLI